MYIPSNGILTIDKNRFRSLNLFLSVLYLLDRNSSVLNGLSRNLRVGFHGHDFAGLQKLLQKQSQRNV